MVTYYRDIPDGPNDPSDDQPKMKQNTNSIDDIINEDHYTFETGDDGQHKQVRFPHKNAQGAQTDPASAAFTASGTVSTVADLKFINQNATFLLNGLRAYGAFTTVAYTAGPPDVIAPNVSMNVSSISGITSGGLQTYSVVLTTGSVSAGTTANNTAVFLFLSTDTTLTTPMHYTISGTTLTIKGPTTAAFRNSRILSFAVFQV